MTQYFIESSGVQPQLFVFAQNIEYKEDADGFETILKEFENNFNEEQERNWIEYWEKQGEQIILQEWKLKYKDYLTNETTNKAAAIITNENNCEVEERISHEAATTAEPVEEYAESWAELWQLHSEEIYSEQYILYNSIYYNYYSDLKKSILTKLKKEENSKEKDCTNELSAELVQLKLLGLPTAFGGRDQNNSKHSKRFTGGATELYNLFFSDDEEDNIEDINNLDDIDDIGVNMDQIDITNEEEKYAVEEEQDAVAQKHDAVEVERDVAEEEHDAAEVAIEEAQAAIEVKQNDFEKAKCNALKTALHKTKNKAIAQKTKRNRKLRHVPEFLLQEKGMLKYWRKRFSLFSRYDDGIRLDRESWFSVTPEKIAVHIAERLTCDILIDGFCGCGGNAIQFARTCHKVIAIDIDPSKLEMAKHNARIYGVADKIDFILGDFLQLSENGKLKGDIVFLSPPWGGPMYKKKQDYDIESNLIPVGATTLIRKSRNISENIALFLPRTSNMQQVIKLAGVGKRCEIEHNYLDSRLVAITALYGEGVVSNKQ